MKDKIKKIVTPIFLSILCGMICGRVMFSIYEDKGSSIINSNLIYLLEDAYDDYDTMKSSTIASNYMYYEEDGKYNAVVAITKNKNNIKKIEGVYNKKLKISEYLVDDQTINNKLDEYDIKIESTEDKEELHKIIIEMIGIYKDSEEIKMVKIS